MNAALKYCIRLGVDQSKAVGEGLWCCPTPFCVAAVAVVATATAAAEAHSQGCMRTLSNFWCGRKRAIANIQG